ncbi:hypothetical protein F183_A48060 [Bryobacterales bacterium F-183]|nr:hypothetical protein F183_A48060 [Bryobacterales bacterium F-183]
MKFSAVAAAATLCVSLFAQVAPLAEVQVTGNRNYTTAAVIEASGLRIGKPVKEADFEAARDRLMATGGFETMNYRFGPSKDGKGYLVTFEVTEVERSLPVKFEDLPAKPLEMEAVLRKAEPLFGGRKAPGNKAVLDKLAKALTDYLVAKHEFEGTVAARVSSDTPGELYVLFRPSVGRLRIGKVSFEGNQVLDSGFLGNAFGIVAIGTEFKEESVQKLLDTAVRPHYEARGFLGVKFPKLTTWPIKDVEGVSLIVKVEEGRPYTYGTIEATGRGVAAKEVYSIANIKHGETANFDAVKGTLDKLVARMHREGYMRAKATYDRRVNDQARTVDVVFKTDPGPQYTFGKLDIKGLDLIGEPAIRKIWGLKAGKPFNSEYPDYFLNNVREQGLFDGLKQTRAETKLDDKSLTADVTLHFK